MRRDSCRMFMLARPAAQAGVRRRRWRSRAACRSSAGRAPIRLLGVSAQGNAVVIEATEPAAYVVSRPDPLTVLVELRNVSSRIARQRRVERRDPIAECTLEQGAARRRPAGRARARLARAARSSTPCAARATRFGSTDPSRLAASRQSAAGRRRRPSRPVPVVRIGSRGPAATMLERVRASRTPAATTVTLGGNGRLTPADVSESRRRAAPSRPRFPERRPRRRPRRPIVDGGAREARARRR